MSRPCLRSRAGFYHGRDAFKNKMTSPIATIVTETFLDHPIQFHEGDAFVNLTTMCKPFTKEPFDFLKQERTQQFMEALEAELNSDPGSEFKPENPIHAGSLSYFTQQGRNGGTWAHPDLALECARWLSPKFAIWTNRIIRELLSVKQMPLPIPPAAALPLPPPKAVEVVEHQNVFDYARHQLPPIQLRQFANFVKRFANAICIANVTEIHKFWGELRVYPVAFLRECRHEWCEMQRTKKARH